MYTRLCSFLSRGMVAWLLLAAGVHHADADEHRLMGEVGSVQGTNHWYYAASQQATGARTALMTWNANYKNQNLYSVWNYAPGGDWVNIRDGSYTPAGVPPGDYSRANEEPGF